MLLMADHPPLEHEHGRDHDHDHDHFIDCWGGSETSLRPSAELLMAAVGRLVVCLVVRMETKTRHMVCVVARLACGGRTGVKLLYVLL